MDTSPSTTACHAISQPAKPIQSPPPPTQQSTSSHPSYHSREEAAKPTSETHQERTARAVWADFGLPELANRFRSGDLGCRCRGRGGNRVEMSRTGGSPMGGEMVEMSPMGGSLTSSSLSFSSNSIAVTSTFTVGLAWR